MSAIELIGAKGGQGTSTVALILAAALAQHGTTLLVVNDVPEAAALAASPACPDGPAQCHQLTEGLWASNSRAGAVNVAYDHVVWDNGRLDAGQALGSAVGRRYIVHRGPDYLAAWHLTRSACPADGLILLQEPGRALRTTDLVEATGLPIAAAVPVAQAIARTIDAGLLLPRLATLSALAPLLALAATAGTTPHRLTA